jgi:hypothetical protein
MRRSPVQAVRRGTVPAAVVTVLTVALAAAQPGGAVVRGLTAAFMLAAPALAVALPLRTLDPPARAVVALGAAATIDTLVAETMLVAHAWSTRNGLIAVGALSALLLLVLSRWLPGRTPTGDGAHPVAGTAEQGGRAA